MYIYIYIYIFKALKQKGKIKKKLKYFTIKHKKAAHLGKMNLFPKISKKLHDVPGRPVISNCGTSTKFLDILVKEVTQNGWSYIKDSIDLCLRIITLSSTVRLNIEYRVRRSALNLYLHMHPFSWMR